MDRPSIAPVGAHAPDSENLLASLQAQVDALQAQMAALHAERTMARGLPPATGNSARAASRTSRRGMLRRLGSSAAGAAVAATALGAARPERAAADAAVTVTPGSTTQFGIYASPTGVTRPALPQGTSFGAVGIAEATAAVSTLGTAGVAGAGDFLVGVIGSSISSQGVFGVSTNQF